jgi:hypothetical protein
LYSGPEIFLSRWTPAALALTHLITVGFMLQVMLGALLQLLPVVAGANLARPQKVAMWVHATITPGTLFLTAAFLTYEPLLFGCAAALLATGVAIFLWAAARALYGIATTNPTIRGFKLALLGLSVTVISGLLLAASLGLSLDLPLVQFTDLHLGWGLMAWGCTVLAAVSLVAVPMFQLTPEYPVWFARSFAVTILVTVSLWSIAELAGLETLATSFVVVLVALGALFSVVTLMILGRSKRPKHDASHHFWRLAMTSACVACALWFAARLTVEIGNWQGWPILFAVLLLYGGFISVTIGMLYKIVPFLVWLHLQNLGKGRVPAPNMKKVLPQLRIDRQMLCHFLTCTLLLLSVFWPELFFYPAGVALIIANGWLLRNLLYATAIYRNHLASIEPASVNPARKEGT